MLKPFQFRFGKFVFSEGPLLRCDALLEIIRRGGFVAGQQLLHSGIKPRFAELAMLLVGVRRFGSSKQVGLAHFAQQMPRHIGNPVTRRGAPALVEIRGQFRQLAREPDDEGV